MCVCIRVCEHTQAHAHVSKAGLDFKLVPVASLEYPTKQLQALCK